MSSSGKSTGKGFTFLATLLARSPILSKSCDIFIVEIVILKSTAIGALLTKTVVI